MYDYKHHHSTESKWFLLPLASGSKLTHITPESSRVYALRMLQKMIAKYKEAKDEKIKR